MKMKLTKILKNSMPAFAIGGIFAISLGFFNLFYNYTNYNKDRKGYSVEISRTEFPFTARTFHKKKFNEENGIEMASRYKFMGTRTFYWDEKGKDSSLPDGFVDKISKHKVLNGSSSINNLIRDRDYNNYKEKFDEANKYLADTKEKFKDIITKYNL